MLRLTIVLLMIGLGVAAAFGPQYSRFARVAAKRIQWRRQSSVTDDMTGWTVYQTIQESISKLERENVTEPDLSAQHLLAASLDLSWESGYRDIRQISNQVLTREQAQDYVSKLQRRMTHEPLQYILGQWDFLDYTVSIKPPLLCPRPETEELVMKIVQETTESPIHILDVGCGTGVIGVALAEQLPEATVEAIDIDPVAIEISMENSKRILGTAQNSCYKATLCSAQDYEPDHYFDIVVSNPPYIPQADMSTLSQDVIQYESGNALCGGVDGLDVVRVIVKKLPSWCNSGAVCWMEVDPTHPSMIKEWLESSNLGVEFESSFKDMFGKDRFVKLRVL
jgi:release factor glutamine methyltransferase